MLVACSATPNATPAPTHATEHSPERTPSDLLFVYAVWANEQHLDLMEAYPGAQWPPEPGSTYAVVDDRGFVGLVTASRRPPVFDLNRCWDACRASWPAAWVMRLRAPSGYVDAIGPHGESFRALRRMFPPPMRLISLKDLQEEQPPLPETPTTAFAWDVAGTGHADLEIMARRSGANVVVETFQQRAGKRVLTFRTERPSDLDW